MIATRLWVAATAVASIASPVTARSFLPFSRDVANAEADPTLSKGQIFEDMLSALKTMQDTYFQPWLGTWPTAIDWTAAVMGSHVAGALSSLSRGFEQKELAESIDYRVRENLITTYFSQLISYYFGQDAIAIRNEAYDDILWVVLGWLDAIQFINYHAKLYYPSSPIADPQGGIAGMLRNQTWYGNTWIPPFAHRSRLFWEFAVKGWDTRLCDGGMNWNPRLEPYKNAITNELWISASANMYLFFPGDDNTSPYMAGASGPHDPAKPHERKYLDAALDGYAWLSASGMTNDQGLFIDGFHISGYNQNSSNTKCDVRNEMVYTYNQGVVLTGLRGLWTVTGDDRYLRDGHRLIQNAVNATGWDLRGDRPVDDLGGLKPGQLPPWRGLGRGGVMEDQCDVSGDCSQDSHTFKGNYFHHFTAFCAPLDVAVPPASSSFASGSVAGDLAEVAREHDAACSAYAHWLRHNARAALATRDGRGVFGMWWTAGLLNLGGTSGGGGAIVPTTPDGDGERGVDYRTYGVPDDDVWVPHGGANVAHSAARNLPAAAAYRSGQGQVPLDSSRGGRGPGDASDPNTRGRGRTVETQGSGLALLRALWEVENRMAR
ncbi:uncharacterized protein E0L32_003294 [Thyridium curvatum]|uniref:Glycosyl hydrolase n=1 Tax=Thyridium curvatum TaxID=1093900 RepID=A0A507BD37_9PEZI|nr:uncharacterized protein E0L32_003294 [Thyridium curvatum]TPX17176.1 hypothetical protein E0L32_003294 [Thyridium curvatum]